MPLSSKRARRPHCYGLPEIFFGAGGFEESSDDKKLRVGLHSAESAGKCAMHHPGTLPKFNPKYQTLDLERSRGSSGEATLDGVIIAPNSST
jgi:hypothetical protein